MSTFLMSAPCFCRARSSVFQTLVRVSLVILSTWFLPPSVFSFFYILRSSAMLDAPPPGEITAPVCRSTALVTSTSPPFASSKFYLLSRSTRFQTIRDMDRYSPPCFPVSHESFYSIYPRPPLVSPVPLFSPAWFFLIDRLAALFVLRRQTIVVFVSAIFPE